MKKSARSWLVRHERSAVDPRVTYVVKEAMSQEGVPSGGLIPQPGGPIPAPRPRRASQSAQVDVTDHVLRPTRDQVYRSAEVTQRERKAGQLCRRKSGIDCPSWQAMGSRGSRSTIPCK